MVTFKGYLQGKLYRLPNGKVRLLQK